MPTTSSPQQEFGPGGYLPDRAARRARKIVLREQMGLGWPLAAVVAALLLILVGAVFLLTRTGPPQAPFAEVGRIDLVDPRGAAVLEGTPAGDLLVVRAGGAVRAFTAPPVDIAYCRASDRLEAADGTVWTLSGRRVGGERASLAALTTLVHDGRLYVDPSTVTAAAPDEGAAEQPACAGT